MKFKVVYYIPKSGPSRKTYDAILCGIELPDIFGKTLYFARIENDEGKIVHEFSPLQFFELDVENKTISNQDRIEKILKEYDNPETEIIFEDE